MQIAARRKRHKRVKIRTSHPGMYHSLMTAAIGEILLGFNFWWGPTPTFLPKITTFVPHMNLIGTIFFALGALLIVFLNLYHDLRAVRVLLACSMGWALAWGGINTQQVIAGKASWQIPILFTFFVCGQLLWWLIESPVNPMTERE